MDIKASGLYKTINNAFRKSTYSQSPYDSLTLLLDSGAEILDTQMLYETNKDFWHEDADRVNSEGQNTKYIRH